MRPSTGKISIVNIAAPTSAAAFCADRRFVWRPISVMTTTRGKAVDCRNMSERRYAPPSWCRYTRSAGTPRTTSIRTQNSGTVASDDASG